MKLVGVTFNNDAEDGGRSRQEILQELTTLNREIITVDLIYTKFNNEFAIKVREHATKQIIGWIAKSDLPKFHDKKIKQMTGFIGYYGVWSVRLLHQMPPTHKQYAYMKHLCEQHGYSMPAYDRRAYAKIFNLAVAELQSETK